MEDHRDVLPPGTILDGKYRIERVLGSGGFGITYEATDTGLDTRVAVKEYYPTSFATRDASRTVRPISSREQGMFERLRTSFLREAKTLALFDTPAIVRVNNVFEANGTAYMVMRYEAGPSLKLWRTRLGHAPSQAEIDRIAAPLLDALENLHEREFLHRDVAPDNIIIRPDGTPVLLDFGASRRVMGELTSNLTAIVKPGFSPPEQYTADAKLQGPWTDIYALGATLYLIITDTKPTEALQRMGERMQTAADLFGPDYRPGFADGIDAALEFRPENRPQSIAEWREMLFDGAPPRISHPPISHPPRPLSGPPSGGAQGSQVPRTGSRTAAATDATGNSRRASAVARSRTAGSTRLSHPPSRSSTMFAWGAGVAGALLVSVSVWIGVDHLLRSSALEAQRRTEETRRQQTAQPAPVDTRIVAAPSAPVAPPLPPAPRIETPRADPARAPAAPPVVAPIPPAAASAPPVTAPPVATPIPPVAAPSPPPPAPEPRRLEPATLQFSAASTAQSIESDRPTAVAVGSGRVAAGGQSGAIRTWQLTNQAATTLPLVHREQVTSLALSANGARLAAAYWDGSFRVFDLATGRVDRTEQPEQQGDVIRAIRFAGSADQVVVAHNSGRTRAFDASGAPGTRFQSTRAGTLLRPVAATISADGTRIAAAGSDASIVLSLAANGQLVGQPLRGHTDWPTALAFSPDGLRLASGSENGFIRLWTLANRQFQEVRPQAERAVKALAFSPDGRQLASAGDDNVVTLWNSPAGARPQPSATFPGHRDTVRALAFDPRDRLLVSASDDGDVRVWPINGP